MASPDFEIAWQVEQDEFCQKVLAKHWPDARRWDDVKTFPPEPVEDWAVDLICGGWPCQPVSAAGRQKGESDERWLWPQFRRICTLLRPSWILAENVPGLLSAPDAMGRRGGLFGGVLRDLADLGYGHVEWHSVSAAQCGASHVRSRVYVLAYSASERQPGPGQPVNARDTAQVVTQKAIDALNGSFRKEWASESRVCRVSDGVPSRMDRLTALGNAVCPPVVEFLARYILEYERGEFEK
jgi:DNA (cytosine-5)-methyltransferase 1